MVHSISGPWSRESLSHQPNPEPKLLSSKIESISGPRRTCIISVDTICDLALTVQFEGIMDNEDLISNRHIGAIASEGSGEAICDIADNWSRNIIKQSLKVRWVPPSQYFQQLVSKQVPSFKA